MSKADKMFEELGYIKSTTGRVDEIVYLHRLRKTNLQIVFDTDNREYYSQQNDNLVTITIKEHLAINEKMKELGWIEGGLK